MKQLMTKWNPGEVPLAEYPRPQMKRDNYEILNGWWDCAITSLKEEPGVYDKKILVPYSPEAYLSGVGHVLKPDEFLHYKRIFHIQEMPAGKRLLLHFGAVDESAVVFVNGTKVTEHHGGYLPFEADITKNVHRGENTLKVCVQDPSDTVGISRGKQKLHPGGMFYQSQSGIWQTVWMEWVPETYIHKIHLTPDLDQEELILKVELNTGEEKDVFITLADQTGQREVRLKSGKPCAIPVPHPHEWSPEDPYLYPVRIRAGEDTVDSYFAMRKFSTGRDARGTLRFFLNNRPYFLNGVLDQGYWPEGLMTPPSDEAFIFDIKQMKELGFNMLRKHVKIEPLRWYYHCDRLGMLVWQDMVNGGKPYHAFLLRDLPNVLLPTQILIPDSLYTLFGRKSSKSRQMYQRELAGMLDHLHNCVSVCTWVPFNEGWGQFDARKTAALIKRKDPTRLVDHASGWFDQRGGDYKSIHNYFFPLFVHRGKRVTALTEYGGFSMRVPEHTSMKKVYGYGIRPTKLSLTRTYARRVYLDVIPNISRGLSVAIYTQLSDIEEEINGIFTWDRKELKMDKERLQKINQKMFSKFERCICKTSSGRRKI